MALIHELIVVRQVMLTIAKNQIAQKGKPW